MPTLRYVPLLVVCTHAAVLPSTSPLALAAVGTAGTYRALIAGGVGDQFRDVAKVAEMPLPELAEDEVLVKVAYAGAAVFSP